MPIGDRKRSINVRMSCIPSAAAAYPARALEDWLRAETEVRERTGQRRRIRDFERPGVVSNIEQAATRRRGYSWASMATLFA